MQQQEGHASTRPVVLHASLIRPKLLMGAERQAVIYNFSFAFVLVMLTRSLPGIIAAVVISAVIQGILVALAKRDAQSLQVNGRNMKYQHFYSTSASLDTEPSEAHVQKQAPIEYLVFAFHALFKGKKHA
ncbi:VirB3 family type IV secretion system protein [Acidithiobacillus sp.]|uniref:VirB3 family type IV secretion system protein n=1 Tax=Acidithiobacillus sp. TaxID=1872118 RepID=UPI003D0336D1